MARRPVIEKIPDHLLPFIAKQDASLYTPIDHASWRFILRISRAFFSKKAHQKYLDGLKETGISTERIPLIEEMDHALRRFGWRAVPVSGFIPPAVFMEFQSLGILPIACEMRTLEHLAYTPAPDIVHEAAGHAPILADQEYADYLRSYGEVARKAIFSSKDTDVYEAIRALSDVKEDPKATRAQIEACQKRLEEVVASVDYVSEATYLARMNWWTVEYGLVGSLQDPKIYGAGLLSSVGESYACLGPNVQKLPLTLDCVNLSYDITRPQPQLFTTPDFHTLTKILEEFATTMAFRRGGIEGLAKAKAARTVTTTALDSGVQLSGVLTDFLTDAKGEPFYLFFQGPTQLACDDQELEGQGCDHHRDGFSAPIGEVLVGQRRVASHELSQADLEALGFKDGGKGKLRFASGVELEGVLTKIGPLVLTFDECVIRLGDRKLFLPEWGVFDLPRGHRVASVFGNAADRTAYVAYTGGDKPSKILPKTNLTAENRELNALYQRVREAREKKSAGELSAVHDELEKKHPDDWLLRVELLELEPEAPWAATARKRLQEIASKDKTKAGLIERGMALLS